MLKFLLRTAIFLLPVGIFCLAADYYFTSKLTQLEKGVFAVWNDLLNGKVNADVVIYGSSRAQVQFDPATLEDSLRTQAYNLGINGYNFSMQYLRHSLLLKHNKIPTLIVLSLDNVTLDKRKELFQMEQFAPYLNDNDISQATKTYSGFKKFDYHLPVLRYIPFQKPVSVIQKASFSSTDYTAWYKGFQAHHENWNSNFQNAVKKQPTYFQRFDSATIQLFDRFLSEIQKQGIKLVFVYSPEYIEGQKFVSNRHEVFNHFYHFSNKYQIPFLDYSSDTLCMDTKYFYDSQHLNSMGASIFTKKLANDLKPFFAK